MLAISENPFFQYTGTFYYVYFTLIAGSLTPVPNLVARATYPFLTSCQESQMCPLRPISLHLPCTARDKLERAQSFAAASH